MKKINTVTLNAEDLTKVVINYDEVNDETGKVIKADQTIEHTETGCFALPMIERIVEVMKERTKAYN